MTTLLFPAYPGSPREPDPSWSDEIAAARLEGFTIALFDEGLFGEPAGVRPAATGDALYRGWIIKPERYAALCRIVPALEVSQAHYMWAYDLPQWLAPLAPLTPRSLVLPGSAPVMAEVAAAVAADFGARPVMVKDYLKSRKHEWHDACFIADASDTAEVVRVASNFFERQGEDFYGGLVFREFLDLVRVGVHPKSKMPLAHEYRGYFLDGKPFFVVPYWSDGAVYPPDGGPPAEWLAAVGRHLESTFVALDLALDESGRWWVIEVNNGGSAGLPDHADRRAFYRSLAFALGDRLNTPTG